jgi:hypothetical protein
MPARVSGREMMMWWSIRYTAKVERLISLSGTSLTN